MKRSWTLLLSVFLLTACGKAAPEPAAQVQPTPEPTAEADPHANDAELLEQYQAELSKRADLEIGLLGVISETNSLDAILKRASGIPELSVAAAVDSSRIIYGDRGANTDNVYLVLPAKDTDVKVGRYNWYAGEITETWLEETAAKPFIYVEDGDSVDPVGRIEYVRHFADGDTDGFMYTGLRAVPCHLRTEYHMGVVDITPYTKFDSEEVPFFEQYYFDTLCSYEEISYEVERGNSLSVMDEMIRDGHAYIVYSLQTSNENRLYAMTRNAETGNPEVICSYDDGMTWNTLAHG